jgi:hypothetical protein
MADEFDFFSADFNNWNYNGYINTPNADPYNKKRVINISINNSYNLMKHNCVIMLKEVLKHTSKYLNDDVNELFKKALQGSKNAYWETLSITTNLFYYYLFRTEETINYKKIRLWFRQNPLYIKSNDETIKKFILPSNPYKNCSYREYLSYLIERERYMYVERLRERESTFENLCLPRV